MHIDLGNDASLPRPASHTGWKIAAFVVSCALALSGTINGVLAFMAYVGGDLVGAVGDGADKALARHSDTDTPDSERLVKDADIKSVATDAHDFALRAKLLAVGIGLVAALELLGGVLVRKRLRTRIVPTVLAVGLAGEIALMIVLNPSLFSALGSAACIFGLVVWAKIPPGRELSL